MANRWGKVEAVASFIFLGSKVTVNSDGSHETKRYLLLGREAMTNLDSVLKSRDITLPTKVHLVKGMVFPTVKYGWESWTIKKAECQRTDAWTVVLEKTLDSPSECKEIKPVNPKSNQSWIFIGRTDAEAEALILWPPDVKTWLVRKDLTLEKIKGRKRRGWQRMRWLDGTTDWMDMNLSKLREMVRKGKLGLLQCMGLQRGGRDWVTEQWVLGSWRWRSSIQPAKTRPGPDCGLDHRLHFAKFRLKLKKVGKTTRPFRYDLNQIPYYTMEVTNRFKGLDQVDSMPEKLWMEVHNTVWEVVTKTISKTKKCKKAKWLSDEALQIAEIRREVKGKK